LFFRRDFIYFYAKKCADVAIETYLVSLKVPHIGCILFIG